MPFLGESSITQEYTSKCDGFVFLYSRRLPENGTPALQHVGIFIFVMNYALMSAFVGWHNNCKKMHSMGNTKFLNYFTVEMDLGIKIIRCNRRFQRISWVHMFVLNTAFSMLIWLDECFPSARHEGISFSETILSRFFNLGIIWR